MLGLGLGLDLGLEAKIFGLGLETQVLSLVVLLTSLANGQFVERTLKFFIVSYRNK